MHYQIIHLKNFLLETELQELKSYLESLKFEDFYIKIFKKQIKIPRLQLFLGEPNISYTYSNQKITTKPWHPPIINLKNKIESIAKEKYNCVLINKYRDGNDYVSFHQDTEKELRNSSIPSFSVGETRTFILKEIKNKIEEFDAKEHWASEKLLTKENSHESKYGDNYCSQIFIRHIPLSSTQKLEKLKNPNSLIKYQLENNDLLIIPKQINQNYKHSIPKEKNKSTRYNLTFRYIQQSN